MVEVHYYYIVFADWSHSQAVGGSSVVVFLILEYIGRSIFIFSYVLGKYVDRNWVFAFFSIILYGICKVNSMVVS